MVVFPAVMYLTYLPFLGRLIVKYAFISKFGQKRYPSMYRRNRVMTEELDDDAQQNK